MSSWQQRQEVEKREHSAYPSCKSHGKVSKNCRELERKRQEGTQQRQRRRRRKEEMKHGIKKVTLEKSPSSTSDWVFSVHDRKPDLAVSPDGLRCQSRHFKEWNGVRANRGVAKGKHAGRFYYEAMVEDEGLCRVGFATLEARKQNQTSLLVQDNLSCRSLG